MIGRVLAADGADPGADDVGAADLVDVVEVLDGAEAGDLAPARAIADAIAAPPATNAATASTNHIFWRRGLAVSTWWTGGGARNGEGESRTRADACGGGVTGVPEADPGSSS